MIKHFKFALTILLAILLLTACSKKSTSVSPPVTPDTIPAVAGFIKGADVSWVSEMESAGIRFYNSLGTPQDPMQILKNLGMNAIRLRVWVNPANNWNNAADVLAKAIRARDLGMQLMIDFHYSDTWADPGHQTKPSAWTGFNWTQLNAAVYDHTEAILNLLKQNNVTPTWVQVGNETNDGMLWPDGKASVSMYQFAQLFNKGYQAVKSVFPAAQVILHLSNGNDNSLYRWMLDGLKNNGAQYDIIGMSLYPSPSNWQQLTNDCIANMNDCITRLQKPVMITEVGMSWDQAATAELFLSNLIQKVNGISNNKGLGVFYWEPECYNNWQGYTLGAFDNTGKPTNALNAFR